MITFAEEMKRIVPEVIADNDIAIKTFEQFATRTCIVIFKRENRYYFRLSKLNGTEIFNSAKENVFYDTKEKAIQEAFFRYDDTDIFDMF